MFTSCFAAPRVRTHGHVNLKSDALARCQAHLVASEPPPPLPPPPGSAGGFGASATLRAARWPKYAAQFLSPAARAAGDAFGYGAAGAGHGGRGPRFAPAHAVAGDDAAAAAGGGGGAAALPPIAVIGLRPRWARQGSAR